MKNSINWEGTKAAFDQYKDQHDISINQHVRQSQIKLGRSLEGKSAIYLDTKYWIILCEAALGRTRSREDLELLDYLSQLVSIGKIFCPISEASFMELMKQGDIDTRKKTATLIDQLSLGIALIPYDLRVGTELAHLIHSSIDPNSTYPLNWLIWTKLSYVLGFVHPTNTPFDKETELLLQKCFFDYMWGISLEDFVTQFGDGPIPNLENFKTLASTLNHGNAEHACELRSYENTYLIELSGIIDLYADRALAILRDIAEKSKGVRITYKIDEAAEGERMLKNLLIEAYRKGKINQQAPTLDIHTHCHASVRWNRGHQFEANDFLDFRHASAALGYCQAFFTERSLCSLLTSKHVSLDKQHNCIVVYKVQDALNHLRNLKS